MIAHHHAIFFAISIVGTVVSLFLGFCWGKSRGSHLEGSPFGIWLGGAMSAFIGGFVEAAPIGSSGGVMLAASDGQVHADLKVVHLLIEAAHVLAIPALAGLAEIRTYIKANPFPNVFLPGGPPSIPVRGAQQQ